jgi:hypothetical protein
MKKCKTCGIDVPPTYSRALQDNKCPACGKEIMTGREFKELLQVRKQLEGLQLEDKLITTIAAALSVKFDLVPKGQRPADEPAEVKKEEIEDDMAGLTEEQKVRERALRAAQKAREEEEDRAAVAEWGLDKAPLGSTPARKGSVKPPQEFVEMFGDSSLISLDDVPPDAFASGGNPAKNSERMIRLQKSEALRKDGSQMSVRRLNS